MSIQSSQTENQNIKNTADSTESPPIRVQPEETLYDVRLDLGETKSIELKVKNKERWFIECSASEMSSLSSDVELINLPEDETKRYAAPTLSPFYSVAFIENFWKVTKSNSTFKALSFLPFYIFGSVNALFNYFFVSVGIYIVTGIFLEIKNRTLSISSINTLLFHQLYILLAIAIANVCGKVFFDVEIMGNKALLLRDFVIFWFFFMNICGSIKYLDKLGVPFPKSLKSKIKAFRTFIE